MNTRSMGRYSPVSVPCATGESGDLPADGSTPAPMADVTIGTLAVAAVGVAVRAVRTDGAGPDHVLDVGQLEVCASKVRVTEIGVLQIGPLQVGAAQVGSGEIGVLQVRVAQVAVLQIGSGEV